MTEAGQATVVTGISGVAVSELVMHTDERGSVCEIFSAARNADFAAMQWHVLSSRAGALRGMHLHARHWDFKVLVSGRETLMLKDLRQGSESEGLAVRLDLSADRMTTVVVPPGIAHGIYSWTGSTTLVGSTSLYDPTDEFEFSWNDPGLGAEWPAEPRLLSERDRNARSLEALLQQITLFQPFAV
jgi:dTDP-4-dehydrorhamnose 3,5-epimerase